MWFRPKLWQRRFFRGPRLTMLAISNAARSGFLGEPPTLNPARMTVVPLGVDTRVFRPRTEDIRAIRAKLELPAAAPLVTLVARFQDVKGHHIFLEMARRVLHTKPGARFAIAGDNVLGGKAGEDYKRRIVDMAGADPSLRNAVKFLGWVSATEELIAASDIVVCSSFFESFGMVHIEAMACEVPDRKSVV